MEYINKLFDYALAFVLMFLIPFIWTEMEAELLLQKNVESVVQGFVNETCSQGYISEQDYSELLGDLSAFNTLYDIQFTNTHTIYMPTASGEIEVFADETGTNQILKFLAKDGVYLMCDNDYLFVTLGNQSDTLARRICKLFLGRKFSGWVGYSGTVYITDAQRYRDRLGEVS